MMPVPWCGLATDFKEDLSRGSYYEKRENCRGDYRRRKSETLRNEVSKIRVLKHTAVLDCLGVFENCEVCSLAM
jgi:hypothetical protein